MPSKWTPTIRIFNIINEYENNKILINTLFNKYWFLKYCQNNEIQMK